MPALTRRRNLEASDECWHIYFIYFSDVCVGIRTGMPPHEDPW
jgi:hypothetical protein